MKKNISIFLLLILSSGCAGTGYWAKRGRDFADIGKASIGVGLGLGVDAQATDFIHPSFGICQIAYNVGHETRYVSGGWVDGFAWFPSNYCVFIGHGSHVGGTAVHVYNDYADTSSFMVWKDYDYEKAKKSCVIAPALEKRDLFKKLVEEKIIEIKALNNNYECICFDKKIIIEQMLSLKLQPYLEIDKKGFVTNYEEIETVLNLWRISKKHTYISNYSGKRSTKVSWVKRMGFEASVSALLVNARVGVNPVEIIDFILGFANIDIAGDDEEEIPFVEVPPQDETN